MLRLRAAVREDLDDIHALIGELADFEHLREQMVGTAADLELHLFGEPRYAHVIMAHWNDALAGFALYFFTYSTFLCRPGIYLEDLFVRPAFRGRGVGLGLLEELERRGRALGCGRFEWSVLDWNRNAIEFYQRFGARPHEGWTLYRKSLIA